jgi:hypothetical protein
LSFGSAARHAVRHRERSSSRDATSFEVAYRSSSRDRIEPPIAPNAYVANEDYGTDDPQRCVLSNRDGGGARDCSEEAACQR